VKSTVVLLKLLASLVLLLTLSGCGLLLDTIVSLGWENPNLLLGNPSYAISSPASADNYLITRPQYVLSYNRDRGIANWASWQLNTTWLGDLPRPAFQPDTTLPAEWYAVKPDDYTGSGFDRGHLVPAADRNRTAADGQSVFLMSNIFPQAPDNNRGPWERLESYCRDLVKQGHELYIMAGGTGSGGIGEKGAATTIGHQISVPASTWKIILVNDRPGLALEEITSSTRVIAVILPNQQGIKDQDWRSFRTSVDAVEALTGYDFLSNLPVEIQVVLEAQIDDR
jgi:endonuclease G, mitochondrial